MTVVAPSQEITIRSIGVQAATEAGVPEMWAAIRVKRLATFIKRALESHTKGDAEFVVVASWQDATVTALLDPLLLNSAANVSSAHWMLQQHLGVKFTYREITEEGGALAAPLLWEEFSTHAVHHGAFDGDAREITIVAMPDAELVAA